MILVFCIWNFTFKKNSFHDLGNYLLMLKQLL